MAKIFSNPDPKYFKGEFPGKDINCTHGVGWDGDHSYCGMALGGSAEILYGKVTCPDCIAEILFFKKLHRGKDF